MKVLLKTIERTINYLFAGYRLAGKRNSFTLKRKNKLNIKSTHESPFSHTM
jgi:hypothetical protein